MSIIAIKNIPPRVTMPAFVKSLANTVKGEFEALDLMNLKNGVKVCYVKLSERLDPVQVIEVINSKTKYTAYVPKTVPNLKAASKKGKIPLKTRLRLRIPQPPHKVMIETHTEILTELQSKYTGLYNLSKKTGHKLMEAIARTIFERLKEISETNPEVMEIGFQLSKFYRKCHPHFGDFQLILSTLHKLQDAAGVPRSQVIEAELTNASVQPYSIDNIPLDKIQSASNKYSERIIKKITEYVSNLDTEVSSEDPEEEVAKKKVREQLQKLSPYLPEIVKQVIANHFIPQKAPYHRVRVYGEPFMPTKDTMAPFVRRFQAVKVMRSDRMYNVLRFNIPPQQYASLMAMDGTVLRGATLVIRSSDIPLYKVPKALISEMLQQFGIEPSGDEDYQECQDEDMVEDSEGDEEQDL
ncbi:uncharacterized protein LOC126378132 [Pectinophora gossypiella]|uniref:uncharacterized protein LOC126378132 n=1 Tax=Pectinophora gossypiella TaxID=13191 RepID=UPI00214E1F2E|nr:uncharacterized protein LOC126378132 [Pectinophora gossypiella]